MDKIIIQDLIAQGVIGIYDWERKEPQDILINLVLYADLRPSGMADDLDASVDYHKLAEKVRAHAENAQRRTVEALAEDLAQICLAEAHVQKVQVRVEKPAAIDFAHSVGVEIERSREQ